MGNFGRFQENFSESELATLHGLMHGPRVVTQALRSALPLRAWTGPRAAKGLAGGAQFSPLEWRGSDFGSFRKNADETGSG